MEEDIFPLNTVNLSKDDTNIYKALAVCGKRANQITVTIKEELSKKLAEFAPAHDTLEEIMENREQIEISKFYEAKRKPIEQALTAYLKDEVYFRDGNTVAENDK